MFLHKDFMPYVVALYRQAVEEDVLERIVCAAESIAKTLQANSEILSFLKIPFVPFEEKISVLQRFIPKETPALFIEFLALLGQNKKVSSLSPILDKFLEYADHKSGIKHIKVVSALALEAPTKRALQKALETQTRQHIKLSITIDHMLIGGIVIHYYHHQLDLSLNNAILSLKSTLKELY